MCRIAGICNSPTPLNKLELAVTTMCNAMAKGGPDDFGISIIDDNSIFGHRRLSLIDLSDAGHQPMLYQNLVITFNGEIYNFISLKEKLVEQGYQFTSHTDTEVILAGYVHWGTKLFEKLEGMFAFALYDKDLSTTYLVRDRIGIKPLYYTVEHQQLIFASEVKAFAHSTLALKENEDWKTYFLAFGHIPHPYTTLKGVYALAGGSYLQWNHQNQTHQVIAYADKEPQTKIADAAEATDLIKNVLQKAVEDHLIADAPIGVFLSGGIDSSIITLLANQVNGANLNTLSINFEEDEFSEAKYQQLIHQKVGGAHQSYIVKEEDFTAHFDTIVQAMDQPSNDGINSWFVNKYAKENGLKAVLSGIGADELFGGYPSFKRISLIKKIKLLPKAIIKLAGKLPSERLRRIYYLSYQNPIGEYLFLRGFFAPQSIAKILGIPKKEINKLFEAFPIASELSSLTDGERASWFETNLFMKNQLLKDTDYMSMSHGIEVRVPFLDQNLLKAVDKINSDIKFNQLQPKALLINSFKDILPKAIWDRPKMGFTFPLQEWFRNHQKVTDQSLYTANPFSLTLIKQFKKGKLHWSKAFALYQVFKR